MRPLSRERSSIGQRYSQMLWVRRLWSQSHPTANMAWDVCPKPGNVSVLALHPTRILSESERRIVRRCNECGGRGKVIVRKCPHCGGQKIVDHTAHYTLEVLAGMPEGHEVVFEGEGDESPDWEAGDVVLRVRSRREKGGWRRKESSLYWKETIGVDEVRRNCCGHATLCC